MTRGLLLLGALCWSCSSLPSSAGNGGGEGGAGGDVAVVGSGGAEGGAVGLSGGGEPSPGHAGAGGDASAGEAPTGEAGQPTHLTGLEPTEPYPPSSYPVENPYSPAKALLGKILFWEEQLSSHDTHACGTCHRPGAGGSDPRATLQAALGAGPNGVFDDDDDARGSLGVARCDAEGAPKPDPTYDDRLQITPRKAPSAIDAWFFDQLFWDGRAEGQFFDPVTGELAISEGGALEAQAASPPLSSVEMSCEAYSWSAIETKLASVEPLALATELPDAMAQVLDEHPSYPELFSWAFGSSEVTARRILFAIATYERDLRSDQTPWDRFNAGDLTALTADQQAGLALFNVKARCATCHPPPLFTDRAFHHIGARLPSLDPGLAAITGLDADLGKMKTPSLRNVALRAPGGLLHFATGTGATLRSVLAVYRQGGLHPENLDPKVQVMNLPEFELEQLLDFLENGLTDPRAAAELPPFDRPRLASEP